MQTSLPGLSQTTCAGCATNSLQTRFPAPLRHYVRAKSSLLLRNMLRTRAKGVACRSSSDSSPATQVSTGAAVFSSMARGFLPAADPPASLCLPGSEPWERAVSSIPQLAMAAGRGELRRAMEQLPPFPTAELLHVCCGGQQIQQPSGDDGPLWRAYLVLSFLSHAYMWCDGPETPQRLPARLAVPWVAVSKALGMPPVLTYATYNLLNWRRLDPHGPVALGNLVCLNNFLGALPDEEWFRLVHVEIEATAVPALAALQPMQEAGRQGDWEGVEAGLGAVAAALQRMQATLGRMGEKCDPDIYYKRVRLPMSGWRANPKLPEGLIYEGVSEEPIQLYGETGAQSSIVPAFDAALGICLGEGWLRDYLDTMRSHMPPQHRAFITALEAAPPARQAAMQGPAHVGEAWDTAVAELQAFRVQHRAFAGAYIARFSKAERGTGGTDFMPALSGYYHSRGAGTAAVQWMTQVLNGLEHGACIG